MGQKINPNIFRLGVNKTWKTEFFEKKRQELPIYTFKDLEIKSYVERFLESQGLFLHDYKQHYSDSTLNLHISYVVSPDFFAAKKDKFSKITIITKSGKERILGNNQKLTELKILTPKFLFKDQPLFESYRIKRYLNSRFDRSTVLKTNKNSLLNSTNNTVLQLKIEGVLNNLFRVLSLFTNNKFNIVINFCCLNKTSSFLKRTQKKNFILLQKFRGTPFLKEGIELLFHAVHNRASANLLAKFIAIQMKKVKRHKFFFSFLKQTLTVLFNSKFSVVRGVKIMIKGRLNGVPRAKHKIINIGDLPVQSINVPIDYSSMTIHNSNGSYGIKVWIIEK